MKTVSFFNNKCPKNPFFAVIVFFLISIFPVPLFGEEEAVSADPVSSAGAFPVFSSGQSPLAQLYRKNASAVVYVTGINVHPDEKSTDEFFRPAADVKEEQTVGTGYIIHPDGYIITNAHTVTRSVAPEIELRSGKRVGAEIIAILPGDDITLLKIEPPEPLTAVTLEPSLELAVGDAVAAIGAPHGLKYTLSCGIISGMDRTSQVMDIPGLVLRNLLQTDAAINPGSSGGPWFNLSGNVVGMTVSKRGDSDNIAFGISLESLHFLIPQMLHRAAKRKWELPFTVVGTREIKTHRARLMDLTPDFIQKTSLRDGDTVTALNGHEILNPADFYQMLLSCKTGDELVLEVERGSEPAFSEKLVLEAHKPLDAGPIVEERLSMKVRPLNSDELAQFNMRVPAGLSIESVNADSFRSLKYAPLPGDILARVNYERPASAEHLAEILQNTPKNVPMNLVILRRTTKEGKISFTRIDIRNWLLHGNS